MWYCVNFCWWAFVEVLKSWQLWMSQHILHAITLAGPTRRQILLISHLRFSPDLVAASKHFWTRSYIWTNTCTSGMLFVLQRVGIQLDPHSNLDQMLILFPCFLDKRTVFSGGTKKNAWKQIKELNLDYLRLLASSLALSESATVSSLKEWCVRG